MALKDIIKKANGLLFEDVGDTLKQTASATGASTNDLLKQLEQSSTTMTMEQMNQHMPGVSASDVVVNVAQEALAPSQPKTPAAPIVSGDNVDFTPIYIEANLPQVALSAEHFLDMLAELGDIPLPAKRTMVGTMLNTMAKTTPGVNSASIANDALLKIKSLSMYSDGVKGQLLSFVADREKSIAEAKARIEQEQKAVETAKERVEKLVAWCEREGNNLDDVLEFFSADNGVSKFKDVKA